MLNETSEIVLDASNMITYVFSNILSLYTLISVPISVFFFDQHNYQFRRSAAHNTLRLPKRFCK